MTYLKSTSIALALSAVLGASAAYAGGDKPTFTELDANADGQVSMTEFTEAPGMEDHTTSEITSKFYDISEGADDFSEDQYTSALAEKKDSTTITTEESSDVMGAVETNDDYDAEVGIETDSDLELESDLETVDPDASLDTGADLDTDLDTDLDNDGLDADVDGDIDADIEEDVTPKL